ncbi:hypothetical protein NTE_03389 [Candidatus Nitrososphaera evergladensis SR1]|uniref:Uncharacterized protein n=1 Tax=Candidatus Nitrososphaera evergladensis SR1 TaxID=1459636 RepID=A0A075MXS9_9ARCH|nr:hypothetical protein [Candidatus Nitrososphaera evergladensis]AIF85417.1 hypothetical protein NTE_03389 [Candidatus Nitrososphaera evergladensis SR1]
MGKYSYKNRVYVYPADDLYEKIKAEAKAQGKSLNEYVKGAIEAFANGEIVQTSKLFTGEPSTACVYGLEACTACPLRKAYPELQKPENALALLKFCNGCHIKKLAIELEKAKIKARDRINASAPPRTTTPAAVPVQQASTAPPRRIFDCINGCGCKLYWPAGPTKDNPKCRPLEAETNIVHFCPLYKPKPKTESQQVAAMVMGRVTCSVCKQGFSADSYGELERDFLDHIDKDEHRDVKDDEVEQLRKAAEVLGDD